MPLFYSHHYSHLVPFLKDNKHIKNDILESGTETLTPELAGRIQYLKVRMIYEAGRDESVKEFLRISQLIGCVDKSGTSRKNYLLITRYMEALVAFRKFRGDDE